MDTRRDHLEKAKKAISEGDLKGLSKALDATYVREEQYIADENDTSEMADSYSPMIRVERIREIKMAYVPLDKYGVSLLLLAVESHQNEILDYLINKRYVEVTPKVMTSFLNLLQLVLTPNMQKMIGGSDSTVGVDIEKKMSHLKNMTLIMFKGFLDYQIFNGGTVTSIKNIFERVGKYLPVDTEQYKDFMQYGQAMVLLHASPPVIKSLDEQFHYSTTPEFIEEARVWVKKHNW